MPGRLILAAADLGAAFGAAADGTAPTGPAVVTPGGLLPAVVAGRRLTAMRWGLIPMGRVNARGRPVLDTLVNARGETLFAKAAFRDLARALVPVAGWVEATGAGRRRQAWLVKAPLQPILAIAAVWDSWTAPGGARVASLATVTCAPTPEVAAVHDRMPAIIGPEDWPLWLGETDGDPAALLRPLPAGLLEVAPA